MRTPQHQADSYRRPVRVLVVTPFEAPDWKWLSHYFEKDKYQWEFINGNLFGRRSYIWAICAWRAARRAANFDLVISHHPYMTLWVAACLRVLRMAKPHVAFSFNHGNKRFFTGFTLWLAKKVLPQISLFNVLSTGERSLFNRLYGIPLENLRFAHWAVQPPTVVSPLPDEYLAFQPYICAMGRNNRDFHTLLKATEQLSVNVLIVCSKRDAIGLPKRHNVKIKSDISARESLQILSGALFSVVPLMDNSTGAGHMTFVHAMQLAKAQVATDVENTRDYFVNDVHGLRVPPKDVEAMKRAIRRLLDEPDTCAQFGAAALTFAEQWLSEKAAARSAVEVVESWEKGQPFGLAPQGWPAYLNALAANKIRPNSLDSRTHDGFHSAGPVDLKEI